MVSDKSVKRVHIKIFGDVHGVGFRYNTFQTANAMKLTGWVKNITGGIEILAEGGEETLNKFIEWCKMGPSFANIDDLEVNWEEPTGEFDNFEVAY